MKSLNCVLVVLAAASLMVGCASTSGNPAPPPPGTLQLSTSSLPGGTINASYSATLAATGGSTPYSWTIASGSLPAGLSLNASTGQISGTPTQSGTSAFTVRVTDSGSPSQSAQRSLSINVASSGPQPLAVATTALPLGQVSQPYSATLQASGGTPSYTWSITSGSLPAGLSLLASSGQITGTPSATGQSTFTVGVVDASSPQQSATATLSLTVSTSTQAGLDQYGGAVASPCAGGAKTDFYVEKDGNGRWWFCTPDGHRMFWQGVYEMDSTVMNWTRLDAKYGSHANAQNAWHQDILLRFKAWGLNAIGEGWSTDIAPIGWGGATQGNPQKMPFNIMLRFLTGGGAPTNRYNIAPAPIKLLNIGPGSCSNTLHPVPPPDQICYHYRYASILGPIPDFYDPNFDAYVKGKAQSPTVQAGSYPPDFPTSWNSGTPVGHSWVTGFVPDDSDDMTGLAGPGPEYPGEDGDVHQHDGMIIATSNPYYTMNTGGCGAAPCSNAEPAGSTNPYADPVNHTKAAWIAFLKARYNNSISQLNTAWNTGGYYTTFDIDLGYPRSMTGSHGVMDEDGAGSWFGSLDFFYQGGMNANLKTDLDDFLEQYTGQYYSTVTKWLKTYYPNVLVWNTAPMCGHASMPRRPVIRGTAKYVDVLECEVDPRRPAIAQQVYLESCNAHPGCRPIVATMYITADVDSHAPGNRGWSVNRDHPTQTARAGTFGDGLITWGGVYGQAFQLKATNGDYMFAGTQTWALTDAGTADNWGLITPQDNPYDGVTPVAGTISCPAPPSVQTNPVPICGNEGTATGQPWHDFITPITNLNWKWLLYLP